jgi:hypothetical protein
MAKAKKAAPKKKAATSKTVVKKTAKAKPLSLGTAGSRGG